MPRPARRRRRTPRHPWERWSDEELLDLRLCDLGLELPGTLVEDCAHTLYAELAERDVRFRPHVWLSSEWFSPRGVPGIAAPFYLAHPRLARLERTQLGEVEGGTRGECLRILRHEAGHALQHAYQLHRRRGWQATFGKSTVVYPDYYRPNPANRNFVQHLRMYYAQSHPDEDFAETFAVWLTPRSSWRRRYAGWPALAKLELVESLVADLRGRRPRVVSRQRPDALPTLRQTLREHYAERRAHFESIDADAYDDELRAVFSGRDGRRGQRGPRGPQAAAFLRRHRIRIRRTVARWTGELQSTLDHVIDDMLARCRVLDLHVGRAEDEVLMDFAMVLAVRAVRSHHSDRDWVAM